MSEKTLHSVSLSCNGELADATRRATEPVKQTRLESSLSNGHCAPAPEAVPQSNGHDSSPRLAADDQLTVKKPSYLGLACSINGYSGITRYDSKLREGFRSRDTSPGTRLIARDASPAGLRYVQFLKLTTCMDNKIPNDRFATSRTNEQPPKSISPLAMERYRHNGLANGYSSTTRTSSSSTTLVQGYSEVDRGLSSNRASIGSIGSPVAPGDGSPGKRVTSPGAARVLAFNQQNRSYCSNVHNGEYPCPDSSRGPASAF